MDETTKLKIQDLIDKAYKAYDPKSIGESLQILDEAWKLIPEDEQDSWDAQKVLKDYIDTYFYTGDFLEAEKWLDIYLKADNKQLNFGNGEFMAGMISFELEKFDDAKAFFVIADEKSEGRVWTGSDVQNMKYLKFYKSK